MRSSIYLLALLFAFSATPAFAHCGTCGVGEGKTISKEERAEKWLGKMTEKLSLTEDQVEQVKPILTDKMEKKAAAKKEYKDKMKTIKYQFDDKIMPILTADQQAAFAEWKAEMKEKKGSHEHKGSKGKGMEKKGS